MRILTNDICVRVFALFDPFAFDNFKKCSTLAHRTSSLLVNCLNPSEPAKLHHNSLYIQGLPVNRAIWQRCFSIFSMSGEGE